VYSFIRGDAAVVTPVDIRCLLLVFQPVVFLIRVKLMPVTFVFLVRAATGIMTYKRGVLTAGVPLTCCRNEGDLAVAARRQWRHSWRTGKHAFVWRGVFVGDRHWWRDTFDSVCYSDRLCCSLPNYCQT